MSLYNISKETSGYYICTSTNKIRSATCNITLAVMPREMKQLSWNVEFHKNASLQQCVTKCVTLIFRLFNPAASMKIGSTAGIIGGVAALLTVVIITICCCYCGKKKLKEEEEHAMG